VKILVTGVSGFIGFHCADELRRCGHEVVAFSRRLGPIDGFDGEIRAGSFESELSLASALEGCQAIVHCAGAVRSATLEGYWKANVSATENLCRAARASGVERFIFVSSLAAGGSASRDIPRDETRADDPATYYGLSKLAAETIVRRWVPRYTILRPCSVYGPREKDFFKAFSLLCRRGLEIGPSCHAPQLSLIYGPDVARCVAQCLEHPATERRTYYLSDGSLYEWEQVISGISAQCGRKPRRIRIPLFLLEAAAIFITFFSRLSTRPPVLTSEKVFEMQQEAWTCSCARFASDACFTDFVKLDTGIKVTYDWYVNNGWLGKPSRS